MGRWAASKNSWRWDVAWIWEMVGDTAFRPTGPVRGGFAVVDPVSDLLANLGPAPAISVASPGVLAMDVEGLGDILAGDDLEGVAVEAVVSLGRSLRVNAGAQVAHARQQLLAVLEAVQIDARRQLQVADLEAGVVRV